MVPNTLRKKVTVLKPITMDQVAAMNMNYMRYSFEYFLDSLERLGIRNFELWAGSPHFCNTDSKTSPVPKMKRMVEERGMKIVCVTPEQCIYPINIAAREDELRKLSVDYFLEYIRQTAELGVDKLLCTSGWGNFDEPVEAAWSRSVDSLEKMAKEAEKEGVVLSFEILAPDESNLVYNFETTKRMLTQLDSPAVKCCIDTNPVCIEGKTMEDYFEAFGDRINHIHLIDGNPAGHLTWGEGTQNLGEHLAALSRHDFSGYMTLELASSYDGPEGYLKTSLDVLSKILPYRA